MLEETDTIESTHRKSQLSSADLLIMRWRVRSQRAEQKDILDFTRNTLMPLFLVWFLTTRTKEKNRRNNVLVPAHLNRLQT
jgi:hypothetical protein